MADGCCHKTVLSRCKGCPYEDQKRAEQARAALFALLDRAKTIDCPVCGERCPPKQCRNQLHFSF